MSESNRQVLKLTANADKFNRWADELNAAFGKVRYLLANPPSIEIDCLDEEINEIS